MVRNFRNWRDRVSPRQPSRSRSHTWIAWLGSLAVLSLVSLNGLSRSIDTLAPERAFRINPFNTEARLSWLVDKLNEAELPVLHETLIDVAETAIAITPLDARLHSLIGELR